MRLEAPCGLLLDSPNASLHVLKLLILATAFRSICMWPPQRWRDGLFHTATGVDLTTGRKRKQTQRQTTRLS